MKNSFVNRKARKALLNKLEERFMTEYITIPEMAMELFQPKQELASIIAQARVRNLFLSLKYRFTKKGIWFGCVDDVGHYGIMTEESHSRFVVTQYYKRMKGIAIRASQASTEAHLNGLLPKTKSEKLIIPSVIPE